MPEKELPKYVCHKEVRALKIQAVVRSEGIYTLHFVDAAYDPLEVPADYIDRHGPKAGGYYVVYKDGYASFSPALAFEEGYTAVSG